jgi:hypothetical protein
VKTQIIQLEDHDDTLSVRDKMDWSQTPRVLLVWPTKGKVLRTRLDLILLERYCSAHGSQLAVVTTDKEVIFHAGQAGIPVFRSRSDAQLQPWGKSYREFRRQDLETYAADKLPGISLDRDPPQPRKKLPLWARLPIFTIGVLTIMTLAAFLLPSAEITVIPQKRFNSLTIPVEAQPDRNQISLSGIVPVKEMTILVEEQLSTPSTGTASIPAEYARGKVVFTNIGEEEITIPQETILSTAGETPVLFRTLSSARVPPEQGSEIRIEVEAYLPGASGNLPANQITLINLEIGADLLVTNPLPTEGGSDIEIPAPNLVDRLKLVNEINQLLKEKASQEVTARMDQDDLLLTSRLNDFEVISEEFSPPGEEPGEFLWLDKSIQYLVDYVDADDLYQLAGDLVKAQYQDQSYQPDLNSIKIQITTSPEMSGSENYQWEMEVSWTDSQVFREGEISQWITATSIAEAERILANKLDLEDSPLIILQPSWWPRIPALPLRIQVQQGGN